jgi:hypothetical protein
LLKAANLAAFHSAVAQAAKVTIFGFNTEVKNGDTVYHVQSEARQRQQLLQTQVFVRGRILGKRATSYAEQVNQPDFSEDKMHELLKAQHKLVVEAVRAGKVDDVLHPEEHQAPHQAT